MAGMDSSEDRALDELRVSGCTVLGHSVIYLQAAVRSDSYSQVWSLSWRDSCQSSTLRGNGLEE